MDNIVEAKGVSGNLATLDLDTFKLKVDGKDINQRLSRGKPIFKVTEKMVKLYGYPKGTAYVMNMESGAKGYLPDTKEAKAMMDAIEEWQEAESKAAAKKLRANVPGIEELQAIADAEDRYMMASSEALEDENNDGVFFARKPAKSYSEAASENPRAALYLKAKSYSNANHVDKRIAGSKAMGVLANGGEMEAAQKLLDNWLSEDAQWG